MNTLLYKMIGGRIRNNGLYFEWQFPSGTGLKPLSTFKEDGPLRNDIALYAIKIIAEKTEMANLAVKNE